MEEQKYAVTTTSGESYTWIVKNLASVKAAIGTGKWIEAEDDVLINPRHVVTIEPDNTWHGGI